MLFPIAGIDTRHPRSGHWLQLLQPLVFVTLIFTPWGAVGGFVALFLAFFGWAWPRGQDHKEQLRVDREARA